ncbi:MAG: protein-methionine-sulfoxide reductase catalytic subunit MsrP, partial [Betaproteobacteria bacterium]|nr:protein-methionine-sulfoxide reductase catalytic subunit MsrP [Betaproteobacteria bacterium]
MNKRQQLGFEHPVASDITPESVYRARRAFLGTAGAAALAGLLPATPAQAAQDGPAPLPAKLDARYSTQEKPTPYGDVTSYNNF